jgi:DNA-binding CsgD family transcriptional regulator
MLRSKLPLRREKAGGAVRVVGREAELTRVEGLLDDAAGSFACLTLEGAPGIGKTTIWQHSVERARARGFTALNCRPSQSEAKLSFAGLGDLLATVPDVVLDALPKPQRRALDAALLRGDVSGRAPDRRTVAVGLLSVLRRLASSAPVIVAVDDAQWLDRSSSAALEFAVRRLDAERIGVVTAVRVTEEPVQTFDSVVPDSRRTAVRVGPLSLAALHEVLKRRVGASFPRPTLVRLEQACDGNAFFALEIARELLRAGRTAADGRLPVPDDLRALVSGRARRLPAETREALLVASALSEPTTAIVEESALGPALEVDMVRLTADGRVAFSHPLFASAVYEAASPARRRNMHRRLAAIVDDLEERARHLALAGGDPDNEIAQTLEDAAMLARRRGGWESAATLLEQAAAMTPSTRPDEIRRRAVSAAEHHVHAGDRPRARELLEGILADTPTGPMRGEALRLLGDIRHNEESTPEARRLYEEALDHLADERRAIIAHLGLSYALANMLDYRAAAVEARRTLELAERIGDDGLIAVALSFCAIIDFIGGSGADWAKLERALELEDRELLVPLQLRPTLTAGLVYLYAGRLHEARTHLRELRTRAVEQGDESDLAFVLYWLVWLETLRGDYEEAATAAAEAVVLLDLTGTETVRSWVLAMRAILEAHRGNIDSARADAISGGVLAVRCGAATTMRWITAAKTFIELSVGNAAEAWQAAEQLASLEETHGIGEPAGDPFLPDALEALIELGELDRAGRLADQLEQRGHELDRAWASATGGRCRGLVLAARGELIGAEAALGDALEQHARLEMPFEEARTLLCLGRVQRRAKKRKAARETLERALASFERLGTPLWADKARAELDRIGVRRAPEQLTATERAVAELAAEGLTNREIAARLFVSNRTVEATLARVYRKLRIRSRAQLGTRLSTS